MRQAFTKAPILYYYLQGRFIYIKIYVSGYAIGKILCQLISDQCFSHLAYNIQFLTSDPIQYHSVAIFSQKMLFVETRYKTHDDELLAIISAFKTWRYYLKRYKYKILIYIDHNNLYRFINRKSQSFKQVYYL